MRFYPNESPNENQGERTLWNQLHHAFKGDEGVVYYRYPIFSVRGSQRREPDFLIVSRKFGIWVIECKGARINQIREIQGHEWIMDSWYTGVMTPVRQAEDQMFEVKALLQRDRQLRGLGIVLDYRVALPFISRHEWEVAGWASHHAVQGVVLTADELERGPFREHLTRAGLAHMPELDDEQWEALKGLFRGSVPDRQPRQVPTGTPRHSPVRLMQRLENRLRQLDEIQERVACETPDGPQRIRGLAGTGKTVLLARRAARMHAAHPDWDIAFVFYTRSLYQQVQELVQRCFRDLTGEAPDFSRLRIWHAWGAKNQTGFYREAALRWGQRPQNVGNARNALGVVGALHDGFKWVCDELEKGVADRAPEPFLDAVLVDEGQDLPPSFYRLARLALRPPSRLYWAYDEAQGIGSQIVPRAAEIFGVDDGGRPLVDLAGRYPCGISKAHNLNRCYRTPSDLLAIAHAVNMGLQRAGGPLQGVTTREDWHDLGYVVDGDFSAASVASGREVVIERDEAACGHPLDDPAFVRDIDPGPRLQLVKTNGDRATLRIIVAGVAADVAAGIPPEDILVITLPDTWPSARQIGNALRRAGINAFVAGGNGAPNAFRQAGHVTISNIFRAKGNEAWKVYVSGLHSVDQAAGQATADEEIVRRNQVFVALTRTRVWCTAIGDPGPLMEEMQRLLDDAPRVRFPAFNQRVLQRYLGQDDAPEQASLLGAGPQRRDESQQRLPAAVSVGLEQASG